MLSPAALVTAYTHNVRNQTMTHVHSNATEALPCLLDEVLRDGVTEDSRNGQTKELIMQQVTLTDPDLYITTPGRKVSLPAQIAETMWLLAGRNDIEWLSHYLPRAKDFSDDGKTWRGGYGPRLRKWPTSDRHDGYRQVGDADQVDQLAHVVKLLQDDPTTRRAVLNIYNPQVDTEPGKDIPCNNWVHLLPRDGVLHGHVAIRSNDLFWGWSGINAFEWTALLQVVAGLTGLQPGSITFSISSLHLYERHWGRAQDIVSKTTQNGLPGPAAYKVSPAFKLSQMEDPLGYFDGLVQAWFQIEGSIRENSPTVLRQIQTFPEPLMQSWLYALLAWNTGDMALAGHLRGTALFEALHNSPKRKQPEPPVMEAKLTVPETRMRARFTGFATKLHAEKNAAYGDSWKKRGEMLGIMANIARKVDRLGVPGGGDTAADTAVDMMMYLIKYGLWLRQQAGAQDAPTEGQSHVHAVEWHLTHLAQHAEELVDVDNDTIIQVLRSDFDTLEHLVEEKRANRGELVTKMAEGAYVLAVRLWAEEQRDHAARNATRRFDGYETTAIEHVRA